MFYESVQSYPLNCITDTNPYLLQTMADVTYKKPKVNELAQKIKNELEWNML